MVAGKGDCGNNTMRIPYLVNSIKYDEARNIAYLNATAGEWKDFVHTYELQLGSVPMPGELSHQKRDYTKNMAIDIAQDFSIKAKVKIGPIFTELRCLECYTAGKFNFEFRMKTILEVPVGLQFRLNPQGVKARARLRMDIDAEVNSKTALVKPDPPFFTIPLSPYSMGGVLSLGPVLDVGFGLELSGLEAAISIIAGATATISDSAVLQADLLDPSNNQFSGWIPNFDMDELELQAKFQMALKAYFVPSLRLEAEALGKCSYSEIAHNFPMLKIR
jgi:hypothetical protein